MLLHTILLVVKLLDVPQAKNQHISYQINTPIFQAAAMAIALNPLKGGVRNNPITDFTHLLSNILGAQEVVLSHITTFVIVSDKDSMKQTCIIPIYVIVFHVSHCDGFNSIPFSISKAICFISLKQILRITLKKTYFMHTSTTYAYQFCSIECSRCKS